MATSSFPTGGNQVTYERLKDEIITEQINCWKGHAKGFPNPVLALMWYTSSYKTGERYSSNHGAVVVENGSGGATYYWVPFHNGPDPDPSREERRQSLRTWAADPVHRDHMVKIEELLDREIEERCFWQFLDGGSAAGLTFGKKVRLCAKWRLLFQVPEGFRFIVCKVDDLGGLTMQDATNTRWDITFDQFIARLSFYSTPMFKPKDDKVVDRMLKRLDFLDSPERISARAKEMREELERERDEDCESGGKDGETMWLYCLEEVKDPKDVHYQETVSGETSYKSRVWAPLTSEVEFGVAIKTVKESKAPLVLVVILAWQEKFYKFWKEIMELEERQECQDEVQHWDDHGCVGKRVRFSDFRPEDLS